MSYLDTPRLHFHGRFVARPSTLNNAPTNFDTSRQFPTETTLQASVSGNVNQGTLNNIDMFWNPLGDGTFGFLNCTITAVDVDGEERGTDPLIGQPLDSDNSSRGGMAKIVDLDPMQQNVSEVWALKLSIPGTELAGSFAPTAFHSIWLQGPPQTGGPSDRNAGAAFQGRLQLTRRLTSDTIDGAVSPFLGRLLAAQGSGTELPALSLNFALRAFNSSTTLYLISQATLAAMNAAGVPEAVTNLLQPLASYTTFTFKPDLAGQIPTRDYFVQLLGQQLSASQLQQYQATIEETAQQAVNPGTPYPFTQGEVVGTIGLASADAPVHFVPSRVLGPTPEAIRGQSQFGPLGVPCFYTPFQVTTTEAAPQVHRILLNLGNSLTSPGPGARTFDAQRLGTLELGLCQGTTFHSLGQVDYGDFDALYVQRAGFAELQWEGSQDLSTTPLALRSTPAHGGDPVDLLREHEQGYAIRADTFVFRLEPGEQAEVRVYVTRWGVPQAGVEVTLTLKTPDEAVTYSNNTGGTAGSPGVVNLSTPQDVWKGFSRAAGAEHYTTSARTDRDGAARFPLAALDPAQPRGSIDGQIYFFDYALTDSAIQATKGPDDLISVHLYGADPLARLLAQDPNTRVTWDGGVGDIFNQYAKIYPIMSGIIAGYETVKKHAPAIKRVLQLPLSDPLHMPVTRDLSPGRRRVIVHWIDAGTPKN